MKLRKSEVKYEMKDESGYNFDVVCTHVEKDGSNYGWTAVVQLKTSGARSPEDALKHLRHAANAFLEHLDEI